MKVMKFGGISLKNSDAIKKAKDIIDAEKQPVVIVVSALYGVTEQLLKAGNYALNNNKRYEVVFDNIQNYHIQIIKETSFNG